MSVVKITKLDELSIQIHTNDKAYIADLKAHFTDYVEGYRHMLKFKSGNWNGKICLVANNKSLPYGLLFDFIKFHKDQYKDIKLKVDDDVKDFFSGINIDPEYNLNIFPRPYQLECIESCLKYRSGIIVAATACHAAGDEIIMADGTIKKIEDIKINDFVIGKDGNPKKVLNIFKGVDDLYKIKPKNNREPITVTKTHILHLSFTPNKKRHGFENVSVEEYLKKDNWYKHISKLSYFEGNINFETKQIECELSPYFIGLYIGDGHAHQCAISNIDKECISAIYDEAKAFKMSVHKNGKYAYIMKGSKNKRNIIFSEFDKLGITFGTKDKIKCENRFIPQIIFNQDIEYRKNVLAGLIDSDGWLENQTYYGYSSKSKELCNNVELLAISIGLVCSKSQKIINNCTYYSVHIMGDISKIPVRVERKKNIKKSKTNAYRSSFDVTYIGKDEFFGIQVEDSLYLTNNGMITHNSGKSLTITYIIKALMDENYIKKTLIIVPTINLVTQFHSDMIEYGIPENMIGRVYSKMKEFHKPIVVSTWQTLSKNIDKLSTFDCIICDEVHSAKALTIKTILSRCYNAKFRYGFTGTMPPNKLDIWNVKSYLGPILKTFGAAELADMGYISHCKVNYINIEYDNKEKYNGEYNDVKDLVFTNPGRLNYLTNLLRTLDGNVLVLVGKVEKEGQYLKDYLDKHNNSHKEIVFIWGDTKPEEREYWRLELGKRKNIVLIATYQLFQLGINAPSLKYILFASPFKSKIRTLQSIGRALRKHDSKDSAIIYDIVDNVLFLDDHGMRRRKYYLSERFEIEDSILHENALSFNLI